MTISLLDSGPRTNTAPRADTPAPSRESSSSPDRPRFDRVMADTRNRQNEQNHRAEVWRNDSQDNQDRNKAAAHANRQEVADDKDHIPIQESNQDTDAAPVGDKEPKPTEVVTATGALKAETLGPHLNVITSETALPNEQSLEAFARSQGLDENAVHWLLSGTAKPQATSTGSASISLNTSASDGLNAGLYGSMFIAPGPMPGNAAAPTPPDMPSGQTAPVGSVVTMGEAQVDSGAFTSVTAMPPAAAPFGAGDAAVSAFAALWQGLPEDTVTVKTAATNTPSNDTIDIQVSAFRMPATVPVWMQQLTTPTTAATPQPSTNASPDSISVSELDLSADLSPEVLDQLSSDLPDIPNMSMASHPNASGLQPTLTAPRPELAPATPAAGGAQPDAALRSENIQNLAEKMGQAVGQRILSEIEKGQWHLKLQLRPATLGHIEVEMRMRSGEMDATFTAPQALTRELLQEGMSRLKDTLSQMGMDVASFNVKDGQTQQRDGEPTPRSSAQVTGSQGKTDAVNGVSAAPTTASRLKSSADGLDILV